MPQTQNILLTIHGKKKINNAIAAGMCVDAMPANSANRPGFKHIVGTLDPRYTLPAPNTFSRSYIPKLKDDVHSFQMTDLNEMYENEESFAISSDGLDCDDVDNSSVYNFCSLQFQAQAVQWYSLEISSLLDVYGFLW